jgi:hypothetical protein
MGPQSQIASDASQSILAEGRFFKMKVRVITTLKKKFGYPHNNRNNSKFSTEQDAESSTL